MLAGCQLTSEICFAVALVMATLYHEMERLPVLIANLDMARRKISPSWCGHVALIPKEYWPLCPAAGLHPKP